MTSEQKLDVIMQNVKEIEALFDLRYNADVRAIKMWQEKTGREFVWPDHADLTVWLLEQLDAAHEALKKLPLEKFKPDGEGADAADFPDNAASFVAAMDAARTLLPKEK